MKTSTVFTILGVANLIFGALLYFGAEKISAGAGATGNGLVEATYGRMNLGGAMTALGVLTLFIRNLLGDNAKKALQGIAIGSAILMLVIISRIFTDGNYNPPYALIVPGGMLVLLAIYGASKVD